MGLPLSLVKDIKPILDVRVGFTPWDLGNTFVVHVPVYILNTVLLAGSIELKAKCEGRSQELNRWCRVKPPKCKISELVDG